MTWTYSVASIATNTTMQVRRLIGDVIFADQQIADEEIVFALSTRSNIYGAAAECARFIAAQYSRKADVVVSSGAGGSMKTNYSEQAKAYAKIAAEMEMKSVSSGGALPYAGGISVGDKANAEADTDRVRPQFNIGMEDNLLNPIGPVGNQTPSSSQPS